MKMKTISILVIIILSGADPIGAQTYAVTLRPSTLGLCLEGIRSISSTLDARLGMSYLSFSLHGGSDQEDYTMDGDFNLSSVSTLIDWYPKLSPFHITGGLVLNFNDIKTLLTPSRSHEINGRVYTPGMLGNLSA